MACTLTHEVHDATSTSIHKHNVMDLALSTTSRADKCNQRSIFANELINEPRCESASSLGGGAGDCAPALQGFIEDASAALRSLDPNHLVTVGEDGFFGEHSCLNDLANPVGNRGYLDRGPPGSGWPLKTGQDVASNHAGDDVDFISVHLW